MTEAAQSRAPFQVLVLPYRQAEGGLLYALFRRSEGGYWQGVAGGGEAGEAPLQAARREAAEEAGLAGDFEFIELDARATIPVVSVTGEFTWGPEVLVIPEHAFGVRVDASELALSSEHTECSWFSFSEAKSTVRWDSNRTALWELDHRLRRSSLAAES
ncbi:NUDIX domain-containing protein [Streptomyces sp. NBC_01304]|uniref:NUDIX domain-containing protein n=1 Tax=Streptomyces sp. NBC_01304 TaxID=2903818 RepID=UPI002E1497EE|nr:NUDIX domain-containing protein [Streptomyces sp. NBC_01304]